MRRKRVVRLTVELFAFLNGLRRQPVGPGFVACKGGIVANLNVDLLSLTHVCLEVPRRYLKHLEDTSSVLLACCCRFALASSILKPSSPRQTSVTSPGISIAPRCQTAGGSRVQSQHVRVVRCDPNCSMNVADCKRYTSNSLTRPSEWEIKKICLW